MKVEELMRTDVVTIREHDPLALALQLMRWNAVRHLPVMRGARVIGMLGERDLLSRLENGGYRAEGVVADVMSSPRSVPRHMEIADAAGIMNGERIDAVVVIEEGHLFGMLTTTDLLAHMAQCEVAPVPMNEPTVASLMVTKVETAHPQDLVADASGRMLQRGIRHLPVVDGENRVIGILSDRDLRLAAHLASSPDSGVLRVADLMTEEPRVLLRDDPLSTAVRILLEDRFGALPVVDFEERLEGMLSYVDVLRYLLTQLAEEERARTQTRGAWVSQPSR